MENVSIGKKNLSLVPCRFPKIQSIPVTSYQSSSLPSDRFLPFLDFCSRFSILFQPRHHEPRFHTKMFPCHLSFFQFLSFNSFYDHFSSFSFKSFQVSKSLNSMSHPIVWRYHGSLHESHPYQRKIEE